MRIVYTGGGTAGHVFPALAVHRVLEERSPGWRAVWIVSRKGPERDWLEKSGVRVSPGSSEERFRSHAR